MPKVTRLSIEPFSLPYSEAAVEDLRLRLARTRWPDEIPGSGWDVRRRSQLHAAPVRLLER